jgi:hypothetical protein
MKCLLDYDYGCALGSNRGHPSSESAIDSALVRGICPMNSLGLRTESMLECQELLTPVADPTAASAMRDSRSDSPPPLFGRHPGNEAEEVPDEALEEEDDLEEEDFDDEDDDEEFEEEDFDDEDDEDIDEELDDEIEDIDVDEDEEDDFDDDEELGGLDDEEEEEPEVP